MRKQILIFAVLLVAVGLLTSCRGQENEQTAQAATKLEVLFINVGKADSALVSFGNHHFLIDTGTAESVPALVNALRSRDIKTLEGVFLTHTHDDHIGGLESLLQLFDVKKVYAAEITTNKRKGGNIVDEIANRRGYEVQRLKAGDTILLDPEVSQVCFDVMGPLVFNADDDNDNSLVLVLNDGPVTCLFAGDMQFAEENSLLEAKALKPCTLLKVGNHGNPDATSDLFLAAVKPKYAVISTDSKIETDTPAPHILAALEKLGAKVLLTQDARTGIAATIASGQIFLEPINAMQESPVKRVAIESLDAEAELLVLRNDSSKRIDLTNWWIRSERGNEMYFFPKGATIEPNAKLSIASGKNPPPADLIWDEKNVWHNSKTDGAIVYDAMGNEVCRQEVN